MSTTMNDTFKTAMDGVESARAGTAHTLTSTLAAIAKAVTAISGVVTVLRTLDRDHGLAWLGLARRRPLQSAAIFGAGLAVGAGVGVLLTPMAGGDMRRTLLALLTSPPAPTNTSPGEKGHATAGAAAHPHPADAGKSTNVVHA
jgi:hypothetical protein